MSFTENLLHKNDLQNPIQNVNIPSNYLGFSNSIEKHQYLFEKKYKYTKPTENKWTLPPVNDLFKEFYQFDTLQQLKHDLNAIKSKLNDYVLEDWSAHTKKKDPSTEIPWKLKNDIQAEFVTVAWCKLFECLHQYKLVKSGTLNSLHLCEAPGAFIAALNHYLHSSFEEVHWKWLSTTLNPYYEGNPLNNMIIDDRFILHTLDRWLFHQDFSGNIMDRKNIEHMAKECKDRLGDVHLITADGSIDCIETPDNQEERVSTLHFCEMCAGLFILAKGGSFLLKMFTLFEAASVNIVFFLNCLFEEVNVFKPSTSKRGNSEVYIVCLNYLKPENINDYLNVMMDKLSTTCNSFPLFPKKYIPLDFCMQHEVCSRKFMFEQIQAIESNIYSYELKSKWDIKKCHEIRSEVRQIFFERFNVRPISSEQKILQNPRSKIEYGIKTQIYRGSHNKRICIKNLSTEEQLFHLRKAFNEIEKVFVWQYEEIDCFVGSQENQLPLVVFRGKPLCELESSLFANVEVLFLRQKIVQLYNIDPVVQGKPNCTLGTAENPDQWSLNANTNSTKFDGEQQMVFYSQILQNIIDIKPNIIRFKNVLFLTHYSVSILRYLSANMLGNCRISGNGEITLEITEHTKNTTENIQELYKTLIENPDILCFVDITHLHRNAFFKAICDYNNQLLISNIKVMLGAE